LAGKPEAPPACGKQPAKNPEDESVNRTTFGLNAKRVAGKRWRGTNLKKAALAKPDVTPEQSGCGAGRSHRISHRAYSEEERCLRECVIEACKRLNYKSR